MPKDACYNKVVSRYGPKTSAYRSGAMAKCRKVGVANWGNKSKKKGAEGMKMKHGGKFCYAVDKCGKGIPQHD
tara:strand:+ start:279 stop:497 length:219 start_codon:yes stop_codon:yes gene_type:complete